MKTSYPETNERAQTGPAAGEWVALTLLGIVGLTGLMLGRQHLADLRQELESYQVGSVAPAPKSRPIPAPVENAAPLPTVEQVALHTPEQLRIANLAGLAAMMRSQKIGTQPMAAISGRMGIPGFTPPVYLPGADGRFSPAFGQAFGLTPDQLQAVNNASSALKERVDATVLANAKVVELGPDSYRIEIAASPESVTLRAEYLATLRTWLGPERYLAFAQLQGEVDPEMEAAARDRRIKQATESGVTLPPAVLAPATRLTGPATLFDSFGGVDRTVTVTKSGGRYSYQSTGSSNAGGSGANLERVRAILGSAASLLPVGF